MNKATKQNTEWEPWDKVAISSTCPQRSKKAPNTKNLIIIFAVALTEAEMNQELEKRYTDFVQGKTKPAAQAFAEIRKDYGL